MGESLSTAAPIGIFDSGVGGLTVARAIIDLLPHEQILYVGDGANGPYGPKPADQVREFSIDIGDYLVDQGCKAIVIACNTATAASFQILQERYEERYDIPVFGVIQPAVRRAIATTRSGRVGVIATEGTVQSGAYDDAFRLLNDDIEVVSAACPRFVDFVERGITTGRQILGLAENYLAPLQQAGVDTLVLGCTHYPLLSGVIQMVIGPDVTLVSSSEETAKDVMRVLSEKNLLAPESKLPHEALTEDAVMREPVRRFETTGDPERFAELARRFLGSMVGNVTATTLTN